MNFETLISDFGIYLEKQGHAAITIRVYSCSVRLFFSHYNSLSVEHLQSYRRWLLECYKPSTVNTRILGMNRFLDFMQNRGLLDNEKANFQSPISAPTDSLRITPTGHYRLRPIREQKHTYLDTVISQKDYDRLKRRLKKDENYFWYFIVRFSPPPARASVNCARSKWRICSLAISISTPKAARYGDCSSPSPSAGKQSPTLPLAASTAAFSS